MVIRVGEKVANALAILATNPALYVDKAIQTEVEEGLLKLIQYTLKIKSLIVEWTYNKPFYAQDLIEMGYRKISLTAKVDSYDNKLQALIRAGRGTVQVGEHTAFCEYTNSRNGFTINILLINNLLTTP
jgi:hypothetical protein